MNLLILSTVLIVGAFAERSYNQEECGQRKLYGDRIVGGVEAARGDWGWQGGMLYRGKFQCGGALINDEWVLTAAHCISSLAASYYSYVFGIHHRDKKESFTFETGISKVIVHENYKSYPAPVNDIALLKFTRKVPYSDQIVPVCLPDDDEDEKDLSGDECWATGWGSTRYGGSASLVKMQINLPILSHDQCERVYSPYANRSYHLCAGESGQSMGQCNGDSGGPVVYRRYDGRYELIGLTSFGIGGCGNGACNTRVRNYMPWIRSVLAYN